MQFSSVLSISSTHAAFVLVTCTFGAAAAPASLPAPPNGALADSRITAAVNFAIVIPAVLRLLENDHPAELHSQTAPASPIAALQRVVLVSTFRSGFCMDLRLNPLPAGQAPVADWQVNLAALSGAAAATGARVEAFDGGWRVCTRRAGRFELALHHTFSLQPSILTSKQALMGHAPGSVPGEAAALGWPVALSLSTP